jgi:membrane-bound serine protease (ClpP class)
MERKTVHDAAAYIRGLAELRGRNAEWAERAVREAVSLTAEAALEENVIDVVAVDVAELMEAIDGLSVTVGNETVEIGAHDC